MERAPWLSGPWDADLGHRPAGPPPGCVTSAGTFHTQLQPRLSLPSLALLQPSSLRRGWLLAKSSDGASVRGHLYRAF